MVYKSIFEENIMSDKYYLHDCNSYTHCCQNTYRVEAKEAKTNISVQDIITEQKAQFSWWQRLLKPQKPAKSQ